VTGKRDPYRLLQVDPNAFPEVVEAAYRALARLYHPDRSLSPETEAMMTDINWAYATLRDPDERAAYDGTRAPVSVAVDGPSSPAPSEPERTLRERVAATQEEHAAVNPDGRVVLDFGRYSGMSLIEIARVDPEYLEWLKRHSAGSRYRRQIDELTARLNVRA
jgi:curved DNA-binding protein CbpA